MPFDFAPWEPVIDLSAPDPAHSSGQSGPDPDLGRARAGAPDDLSDEEVDAIFEAMLDDANDDQRTEILSWGNGSADLSTLREEAQRLAVELSKTARHDPDDAEHKTARELAKAWGKSDDGRVDLAATSLITEPPPAAELSAEQVPDDDTERAEARALAKKWKEHE